MGQEKCQKNNQENAQDAAATAQAAAARSAAEQAAATGNIEHGLVEVSVALNFSSTSNTDRGLPTQYVQVPAGNGVQDESQNVGGIPQGTNNQ